MKNNLKEIVILIIQLVMFYVFPLFAGPTDAMGMVFLILCMTLILSMILGITSINKMKYLYPLLISILFIPSIWIYYNESALIHALWYFVVSIIGLIIGLFINKLLKLNKN